MAVAVGTRQGTGPRLLGGWASAATRTAGRATRVVATASDCLRLGRGLWHGG